MTIKIRTITDSGQANETTEYYKGDRMRRDFAGGYQVIDFSSGQSFSVDIAKREIYPFDGSKHAIKKVVNPAHRILVESPCSATGEERQWFGYVARRYLTIKKSREEWDGKVSRVRETRTDSWVIDLEVPPHIQGISAPSSNSFLSAGPRGEPMKVPDFKVTHSGPVPRGLVVWQRTNGYESEVVEFSLAPLEDTLFEAPEGFGEAKAF